MKIPTVIQISLLLILVSCGAADQGPGPGTTLTGTATGDFDTEIFNPAANPENYGRGSVTIKTAEQDHILAQASTSFPVDAEGRMTLDPEEAVYFAIQIFQFTSPITMKVLELRIIPSLWLPNSEIDLTTPGNTALFGLITFDQGGRVESVETLLAVTEGTLQLTEAGQPFTAPVSGFFTDLQMKEP